MERQEYLDFHATQCTRMLEITRKKNADYTGDSGDPFFNFTRVEAMGIASTPQGFLTRMLDKFARITSFAQKGKLEVEDESVQDTLLDLANYCILMMGYIEDQKIKAAAKKVMP